jgi:hypothetical protein
MASKKAATPPALIVKNKRGLAVEFAYLGFEIAAAGGRGSEMQRTCAHQPAPPEDCEILRLAALFDQASNLDGRRGSPAMALVHPRPPSPEPAKSFALPADDRVGADVNQGSAPAGPQQGQPHPE